MALTRSDKEDIQKMFTMGIDNLKELNAKQWELVDEKLDRMGEKIGVVDAKVSKTNGSVLRHEDKIQDLEKNLPHTELNCPHTKIITELRDVYVERKGARRWRTVAIAFIVSLASIAATIVAILELVKT